MIVEISREELDMKNYKKPTFTMPPRYYDATDYRRWAGRLLIASGVLLIVVAFVISGGMK
jgi:hypothetical protein